jgi:hypothetical protein
MSIDELDELTDTYKKQRREGRKREKGGRPAKARTGRMLAAARAMPAVRRR